MKLPLRTAGAAGSLILLGAAVLTPSQSASLKQAPTGNDLFAKKCAPCHGDKGQGGSGFSKPLHGAKTIAQLASFIQTSMPPPGKKLSQAEAQKIAAYMHPAFYAAPKPQRVELSRLTVKQFQNALADLVAPTWAQFPTNSGGLKAEYYKGRHFNEGKLIERTDPQIKFDFGTDAPAPEKFDHHTFSVVWQGSIFAPDSGDYDFILRSDQAARMWINGQKQPLVDGWVRATTDREFSGSVKLLGGRAYPIRIEFSKAVQGVDDGKKEKPRAHAFVEFLWKRPKGAAEIVPSRFLYTDWSPQVFVPSTAFPADDRSMGFERGTSVSKEWEDATTAAALETAGYIADNLEAVTGVKEGDPDRTKKLQDYAAQFATRAFRRPLTSEQKLTYIEKQFRLAGSPSSALKRTVLLTLMSPRFLYRDTKVADAYSAASELALAMWDSLPDQELTRLADNKDLDKPEVLRAQAERLAQHPRAWTKLRDFLLLWLKVDETPQIVKSQKLYPGFDAATVNDLRTSFELSLEDAAWKKSSLKELLTTKQVFLNDRLATIYIKKVTPPPADTFAAFELDPEERSGILTHPYLLSRFAYLENSSPIHRGVLIARNLLGRVLSPPPAAFAPLAASLHPDLTTRERVAMQTKPAMCNSCHSMINPLGFPLERFDAIGRVREVENGKKLDTTGSYVTRTGKTIKFTDAPDLARFLATNDETETAFVEKLFLNFIKQSPAAYGPNTLSDLKSSFEKSQYSIRKLMVEAAVKAASK
jgi:mono/diheme cytochrome c family protein